MGQRLGQRRLAVATSATQRGGDGCDGVALCVEQTPFERIELFRTVDEIRRRLRRHHRHALLPALILQDADEGSLLLRNLEIVNVAEPARRFAQITQAQPLHRADRLALLTGEPNLAPDVRAFERSRGDDANEMLQRLELQDVLNLAQPVAAAFERNNVLPDREVFPPRGCF
jgi:hypothetical protein